MTRERPRTAVAQAGDLEAPAVPELAATSPERTAFDGEAALRMVQLASADERPAAVQRLRAALEALRQRGPGAGEEPARWLLGALERGAFTVDGVGPEEGGTLRHLAIEALLAQGYPYALQVRPEDWAYWRGEQDAASGKGVLLLVALGTLAVVGASAGGLLPAPPAWALGLCTAGAALGAFLRLGRNSTARRLGRFTLALAGACTLGLQLALPPVRAQLSVLAASCIGPILWWVAAAMRDARASRSP